MRAHIPLGFVQLRCGDERNGIRKRARPERSVRCNDAHAALLEALERQQLVGGARRRQLPQQQAVARGNVLERHTDGELCANLAVEEVGLRQVRRGHGCGNGADTQMRENEKEERTASEQCAGESTASG